MTYNEQHRNHYNCLGLYYAMRFLLSLVCCFFLLQFAFRRNETVILFFFSSELIFFFICIQHRFQWVICMNYALLCLNDLFDRLDNTIFLLLLFFFSSFFYLCVELVEFGDCASRSNFFLQIFSSEIPSPKILTIFFCPLYFRWFICGGRFIDVREKARNWNFNDFIVNVSHGIIWCLFRGIWWISPYFEKEEKFNEIIFDVPKHCRPVKFKWKNNINSNEINRLKPIESDTHTRRMSIV